MIDRNTGFAHMTRGMNMYTLVALRSCVSERDIPVLVRMLADRDHVTQLSAANVLADMGEEGKRVCGRHSRRRRTCGLAASSTTLCERPSYRRAVLSRTTR